MFPVATGRVLMSHMHDVLPQANGSAQDPAFGVHCMADDRQNDLFWAEDTLWRSSSTVALTGQFYLWGCRNA